MNDGIEMADGGKHKSRIKRSRSTAVRSSGFKREQRHKVRRLNAADRRASPDLADVLTGVPE